MNYCWKKHLDNNFVNLLYLFTNKEYCHDRKVAKI